MSAEKKQNIIGRAWSTVVNLVVPPAPEENKKQSDRSEPYHRFGSDNLFPQAVSKVNRQSPTHRAVLTNKVVYCTGNRLFLSGESEKNLAFNEFVKAANSKKEPLRKVHKKLVNDKLGGGNAYLEIVTDKARSFIAFFHRDWTTCRVGKGEKKGRILIHPNWACYESEKSLTTELPLYPNFETIDGAERCIFHFKDYEPEFEHYGVPVWIAAMDAAGIAYKTNKWNISRLDNSFHPSGVLIVDGNIGEEDAKKLKKDFKETFTGEGKQGKIFFIIKQLGGEGTKFESFNNVKDGDWGMLQKQSAQDVISSHNWFRSLSGLPLENGMGGNNAQIRTEFEVAKATTIGEEQAGFLETYATIITETMGWKGDDLFIDTTSPVSIMDLLDPKAVLSKNEQREVYGYEEIEEQTTQPFNGIQATAFNDTVFKASTGVIPKSAAKITLLKLGATEDEATAALADISDDAFTQGSTDPNAADPAVTHTTKEE